MRIPVSFDLRSPGAKPIISYPGPLMRCVLVGRVCSLKIARLPAYGKLLKIGKERKGALFLDIGCCLGNDVRKVVVDGFPMNQVFASDLRPGTCHQQFITVIRRWLTSSDCICRVLAART